MALQDYRIQGGPKANCDQLPASETLSGKSKGRRVIVMDGMESDIEPADPVMEQMPDEILKVKEQEVADHSGYQLKEGRSPGWQVHRWPPCPLSQ